MIDPTFIDAKLEDRGLLVRRALVLLVVLVLFAGVLLAWGKGAFRDDVRVSAQVDDVGGALSTGNDVKVKGVIVGRVESIETHDGGVRLGLLLDGDEARLLTRDVKARVLPASVFGTTYVDLTPPRASGGQRLQVGDVIAQDRTSKTLELQDALDSTYRVMTAVKPAQLSVTLGALADALDGRGAQIGETVDTLDAYLARLEPQLPLLQQDVRLLATNLQTASKVMPDLLTATDSGLVTARTIVARRAQLTSIIAGGTALADEADRLVSDQEQPVIDTIRSSATLVSALHDERAGIADGFRAFARFAREGQDIFNSGPWMSTEVRIKTGNDAPYTAADCPRFGPVAGDNCGGANGTTTRTAEPEDDAALLQEMRGLLDDLDAAGTADGGVGELLSRPYLDQGDAS